MSNSESEAASDTAIKRRSPLKPAALVIGSVLSLFGGVGQFYFVDSYGGVASARSGEMREIERTLATLRTTQNEYFNAYVQANLLFALDPADISRNRGVTAQMYRLAIYDRAFPFRAIMAELAISGVFEFKSNNDKYRELSDAARAELTFERYNALNTYEREILDKAFELQKKLEDRHFVAEEEKNVAENVRDVRKNWLMILAAFGTIFLLAANLVAERQSHAK